MRIGISPRRFKTVRGNGVEPVDRPKDNQARSVLLTSISECHYGEI